MMLDEIFEHGHHMALARNPARRAVKVTEPDSGEYYMVRPDALAALAVKKNAKPDDLLAKLTEGEATDTNWVVDHVHCWCNRCAESRRMSQTHCD